MKDIAYSRNMSKMDAVKFAARNPYAWPGGYEVGLITTDGALLCNACVRAEYRQILEHTRDGLSSGWGASACTIIYPDMEAEYCSHCSREFNS